ncbi:MAG: TolC family protein [Bacteroidales bacterium]
MLKKIQICSLAGALVFLLSVPSLQAQQVLTLQELIERSLEYNYQLRIVRNQQQMAENMNTAGNAGMLPQVNASGQYTRQILDVETNLFTGETRSGSNALSTSFNAFVEADWRIFDGFSMFARRDRLDLLARLGELDTRYFVEQTVADIARSYFQMEMEEQLLDAFKQSLSFSAFRLQLEDQKRSLGTGNALRYYQAVVDFNSDSSMVAHQQMMIRDLQIRLNRIVNLDPETRFHTQPADLPRVDKFELQDQLLDKALNANKDMARAQLEELLAETSLRMERGQLYPQVNVFAGYGFNRQTSELGLMQSSRNFGPSVGVSLRFNLYDGGRQTTRLRNVALEQQSSSLRRDDISALLRSELARMANIYQSYAHQYELLLASRQSVERTLEIASRQLESGTISGFDFRQTQLTALNLENQILRLKFAMKTIELDVFRITGDLVEVLL